MPGPAEDLLNGMLDEDARKAKESAASRPASRPVSRGSTWWSPKGRGGYGTPAKAPARAPARGGGKKAPARAPARGGLGYRPPEEEEEEELLVPQPSPLEDLPEEFMEDLPEGLLEAPTPRATKRNTAPPVPEEVLEAEHDMRLDALLMSEEQMQRMAERMAAGGLLDQEDVYPVNRRVFEAAWDELVARAEKFRAAQPDSDLTPYDMLDLYYPRVLDPDGKLLKPPKAKQVVDKRIGFATNEDARALLSNMLTRELGRRPTEKDVDDFQAALNDAQRRNPFVTTQETYPGDMLDGSGGWTKQTTRGGVDPQAFAQDYFDEEFGGGLDSEYGAYQAATSYMSALWSAITGGVPGGGS